MRFGERQPLQLKSFQLACGWRGTAHLETCWAVIYLCRGPKSPLSSGSSALVFEECLWCVAVIETSIKLKRNSPRVHDGQLMNLINSNEPLPFANGSLCKESILKHFVTWFKTEIATRLLGWSGERCRTALKTWFSAHISCAPRMNLIWPSLNFECLHPTFDCFSTSCCTPLGLF